MRTRAAVTASIAVGLGVGTASGNLLVYDPFNIGAGPADYLEGDDSTGTNVLGGQNPATGPTAFYWGPWVQSGGDAQAVKNVGSLDYPNFPKAGGRVQETLQFSVATFGRTGREMPAGTLGSGRFAQTLYQSFLIDFGSQGTDPPADFGKRAYEMWNGGIGDSFLAVDLFVNHFSGVNNFRLAVTTPSGTTFSELDGGIRTLANMVGVHLVVMKFEFDPALPDVVSVFLDPTDSVESHWTPSAVVSAPNSDLVITHHGVISQFTFSGPGHIPGSFDELRWGDTFPDVTPFVPEPTAGVAMGLLAGGVVFGRRGRRAE